MRKKCVYAQYMRRQFTFVRFLLAIRDIQLYEDVRRPQHSGMIILSMQILLCQIYSHVTKEMSMNETLNIKFGYLRTSRKTSDEE